jgi:hypothetical protein
MPRKSSVCRNSALVRWPLNLFHKGGIALLFVQTVYKNTMAPGRPFEKVLFIADVVVTETSVTGMRLAVMWAEWLHGAIAVMLVLLPVGGKRIEAAFTAISIGEHIAFRKFAPWRKWLSLATTLTVLLARCTPAAAFEAHSSPISDGALCLSAIKAAEKTARLPPKLLDAIGTVESGRLDARKGVMPWPWTINIAGTGRFFETKAEAISAVQAARAGGVQSIDVGCMQVNLMYHSEAFASLDQAFDPTANAVYAAGFLNRLFIKTGNWSKAIAAYHSQTPGESGDYAQRVIASWPLASRYGADGTNRLGGRSLTPGLFGSVGGMDGDENGLSRYLHNYTTGFRMRLVQDEADRARLRAMGVEPALPRHDQHSGIRDPSPLWEGAQQSRRLRIGASR